LETLFLMAISDFFGAAARASRTGLAAAMALAVLAACAGTPQPVAEAPKPPREALPLDAAVLSLADSVLLRAELPAGRPRQLVIDPLIDRATGTETSTTRAMSRRIAERVRDQHPDYQLQPFTLASLEEKPLVLLGAITGVVTAGSLENSAGGPPGAYRIWAVLADLASGTVVAHETAWVRPEDVDQTPTAFHQDSPVWLADPAAAAYLRVCAGDPGDPIDPDWLAALQAEALLADATTAYEAARYDRARALFADARAAPKGAQLRTFNGLYLATAALDRPREAEQAFGELVQYGLDQRQLAVKFLFRTGSTAFFPDPEISGAYPMWLRQIARQTRSDDACLQVIGHASPTGPRALNDRLSLQRARKIRSRLVVQEPVLAVRTEAEGVGEREPIIGTGTNDATDALDRRVEFQPQACGGTLG
jgi:outer membrane protein OmpA-like peptidoglycan-associated protein